MSKKFFEMESIKMDEKLLDEVVSYKIDMMINELSNNKHIDATELESMREDLIQRMREEILQLMVEDSEEEKEIA